jgi:hypothetical protein
VTRRARDYGRPVQLGPVWFSSPSRWVGRSWPSTDAGREECHAVSLTILAPRVHQDAMGRELRETQHQFRGAFLLDSSAAQEAFRLVPTSTEDAVRIDLAAGGAPTGDTVSRGSADESTPAKGATASHPATTRCD